MARAVVLLGISAALLVTAWLELEATGEGFLEVAKVVGLALVPALAFLLWKRLLVSLALLVLATITAFSVTLDAPLTDMRPWSDQDFWGPVASAGAEGFRDMYEARAPFDPLESPELAGLILLAIFAFLAAISLLVVTRHRLWAGAVLLIGVAFPMTITAVSGQSSPLRTGAIVLAALLVFLFLSREGGQSLRRLLPAAGLGSLLVLVAVAASTSGAVSREGFVGWQRWDFYDPLADPVGVRYVWSSNYEGVEFPDEETVVLRIKAPRRSVFWRAAILDVYNGYGWDETLTATQISRATEVATALADPLQPELARDEGSWTRQDVTVAALADPHLVGATEPVRWELDGTRRVAALVGGSVVQEGGLAREQQYSVWSYTADVQPKELARLPVSIEPGVDDFRQVLPGIAFPAFGNMDRQAMIEQLYSRFPTDVLLAHAPLYDLTRELVRGTTSPYLAAATLEAWFRSSGEFTYDQAPGAVPGTTPPLVDFVLRSKRGYCQHYAGAMALMLRMLGIPARVGAGFVTGTWDDRRDEWVVTDHDAHTWVEVYFPTYGWLTFNPTPERGDLDASYSTTSSSFPDENVEALGIDPNALSAALLQRLAGIGFEGLPDSDGSSGANSDSGGGGPGIAGLVAASLAAVVVAILLLKAVRRRLRFLGRDPRKLAAACRRDLVGFLADQGVRVPASTTLQEIGAVLEQRFGLSAAAFVRAASAARFGPREEAAASAARARSELRALEWQLRRQIGGGERVRGAFSFRSLAI